ncbi:hypothetical protein M2302_002257 [Micromonospora sp. A200]|uniref:hypothetical protein n=1 Tax=Micromonospora sp. A200 TaxID=2940568 RepID=UPI002475456A|nr:hypothetical protein [Micromonospora sp. A200]MDH6462082.1 hypothetical protein [Micromonospora sp. A200]
MNNIMAALLAETDADRDAALNREVLRQAVARNMFCSASRRVLDVRTAVYVSATTAGRVAAVVLDGEVYDRIRPDIEVLALAKGSTLEIIDGRTLS